MIVRAGMQRLWSIAPVAVIALGPAPETHVTIETLTCHAFAAEVATFDSTHPGAPRSEMPLYRALIAAAQARTNTSANEREIAAALDDTLVDCAASPEARVLDLLARHRVVGDRWRE